MATPGVEPRPKDRTPVQRAGPSGGVAAKRWPPWGVVKGQSGGPRAEQSRTGGRRDRPGGLPSGTWRDGSCWTPARRTRSRVLGNLTAESRGRHPATPRPLPPEASPEVTLGPGLFDQGSAFESFTHIKSNIFKHIQTTACIKCTLTVNKYSHLLLLFFYYFAGSLLYFQSIHFLFFSLWIGLQILKGLGRGNIP